MWRAAVLALLSCTALAGAASAAALDGKGVLLCTFASAAECDTNAQCVTVTLEDIGLPESFNIDFKGKRLSGPKRSSPIDALEIADTVLIAQGHESGRGWSMAIDRATGHMNGTIVDFEGTFVLTATCAKAP